MKPGEARGKVMVLRGDEPCLPLVRVARDPWLRFRGLMNRSSVPVAFGDGLLFPQCRSLHTCFMRFALDVAFLDHEGNVVEVALNIAPWKAVNGPREARHALEVTAGRLSTVQGGDRLEFLPVE